MVATIVEALAGARSAARSYLRRPGAPRGSVARRVSTVGVGQRGSAPVAAGRVLRREPQRDHDRDRGPARLAALDRALAADPPRALAHAEDAQRLAARTDLGQADTVVGDLEPELGAIEAERDLDAVGAGVARDVGQRLLEDPEHVGREVALELQVAELGAHDARGAGPPR